MFESKLNWHNTWIKDFSNEIKSENYFVVLKFKYRELCLQIHQYKFTLVRHVQLFNSQTWDFVFTDVLQPLLMCFGWFLSNISTWFFFSKKKKKKSCPRRSFEQVDHTIITRLPTYIKGPFDALILFVQIVTRLFASKISGYSALYYTFWVVFDNYWT